MSYPQGMQDSINNVTQTRNQRISTSFPELTVEQKAQLLKQYHPDFNTSVKRKLVVGSNRDDLVPNELADLLEAPSRLDRDMVNLAS